VPGEVVGDHGLGGLSGAPTGGGLHGAGLGARFPNHPRGVCPYTGRVAQGWDGWCTATVGTENIRFATGPTLIGL